MLEYNITPPVYFLGGVLLAVYLRHRVQGVAWRGRAGDGKRAAMAGTYALFNETKLGEGQIAGAVDQWRKWGKGSMACGLRAVLMHAPVANNFLQPGRPRLPLDRAPNFIQLGVLSDDRFSPCFSKII